MACTILIDFMTCIFLSIIYSPFRAGIHTVPIFLLLNSLRGVPRKHKYLMSAKKCFFFHSWEPRHLSAIAETCNKNYGQYSLVCLFSLMWTGGQRAESPGHNDVTSTWPYCHLRMVASALSVLASVPAVSRGELFIFPSTTVLPRAFIWHGGCNKCHKFTLQLRGYFQKMDWTRAWRISW